MGHESNVTRAVRRVRDTKGWPAEAKRVMRMFEIQDRPGEMGSTKNTTSRTRLSRRIHLHLTRNRVPTG